MACPLAAERIWTDKLQYQQAEQRYYEHLSKLLKGTMQNGSASIEEKSDNCEIIEKKKVKPNPTVNQMHLKNAELDNVKIEMETIEPAVAETKSPMKKLRKSKKEKKEIAAAAAAAAASDLDKSESTETLSSIQVKPDAPAPKSKSKKDKLNKAKMLNKQSTTESLKSNEEVGGKGATNSNSGGEMQEGDDMCPFKVAIENAKTKKPKKKKNKETKGENSFDDVSLKSTSKDEGISLKEHGNNVKEQKEKRGKGKASSTGGECTLVTEIAKARQHIKNSLERMDEIAAIASSPGKDVLDRISTLEKENSSLRDIIESMRKTTIATQDRIKQLEIKLQALTLGGGPASASTSDGKLAAPAKSTKESDEDDGVDLFASDSEDEEDDAAAKVREQRLAEYAAKKSKKPALIAKSNVILDVKPWDDETDMKKMEQEVRKIQMDGLLWGAAKLVPLAFGIHKLQIATVIEDDKVSVDLLIEEIEKNEDFVQSVDVAAFNKI